MRERRDQRWEKSCLLLPELKLTKHLETEDLRNSLVVQRLGFSTFNAWSEI